MKQTKFFTSSRIAVIALFSALAGVLYVFGIAIPVAFAPWLELNFSDIPLLIGTFALGPVSGALIVVFKIVIKLIIKGTSTVFVGELADLLIGLGLVVPCGIIYKKHKSLKGAGVSLLVGGLTSTLVAIVANWLILIPFYVNVMNWNMEMLAGMLKGLYANITVDTFFAYYLGLSVLPFNLMRCLIAAIVTALIYKRISRLITRLSEKYDPAYKEATTDEEKQIAKKRTVKLIIVCAVVLVLLVGAVLLRYFLAK